MKFSEVIDKAQEATSIRYNNLAAQLKRNGKDVIVLSLGEAFFDLPLYDFGTLPHPVGFHYSDSRGIIELRQKVSEYYSRKFNVSVDPNSEILITAGSKAAIYFSFLSILDPGDEVIVPEPAWVSYSQQVVLCHGRYIGLPVKTPISDFDRFVTPRSRAIVLNSPHNPTGHVYSRDDLNSIFDFARRHDLWVLSDEAYSDFTRGEYVSMGAVDHTKARSLIFNSISKNFGISGWRLGYVIGSGEAIYRILKANQHIITCPATTLEYYVAEHFEELEKCTAPQIEHTLRLRGEIAAFMASIGLQFLPGEATFYFFVSLKPSRLGSEAFCTQLLNRHGVSVVPGIGYGVSCDDYVRVSIGTETVPRLHQGLNCLAQLIRETS